MTSMMVWTLFLIPFLRGVSDITSSTYCVDMQSYRYLLSCTILRFSLYSGNIVDIGAASRLGLKSLRRGRSGFSYCDIDGLLAYIIRRLHSELHQNASSR